MATFTCIGSNVCGQGDHFDLTVTGDANFTVRLDLNVLRDRPRANLETLLQCLREHCEGMTKAQARAALASPGVRVQTVDI